MTDKTPEGFGLRELLMGCAALAAAVPVSFLVHSVSNAWADDPEKGIVIVAAILAAVSLMPVAACRILGCWRNRPSELGLLLLAAICVGLVSVYSFWVSSYVLFPADILIWGENDVINDVIKIRTGYPLYSTYLNNESQVYPPGAQIITYSIVRLLGNVDSISLYRVVQCGYNVLTAIFAAASCNLLMKNSFPDTWARRSCLWNLLYVPAFFLLATNSITNPFVHNIHNDALLQLGVVVAYWLLLKYVTRKQTHILILMAALSGLGFLVKQNFVIWVPLISFFLLFFDRELSIKRVLMFNAIALTLLAAAVGGCFLIWGDDFFFWVFTVLGNRQISALRGVQHILDAWPFLTIGVLGGLATVKGEKHRQILGMWMVWLLLFLGEAYTSGAAWTLSHMGPGSVIAGIWFMAALTRLWTDSRFIEDAGSVGMRRFNMALAAAMFCLVSSGLGVVRIPHNAISHDAYRYVNEIEDEFEGESPQDVLLDVGSWVYLGSGTVMKDRATAIGDRGYQGMGGFSDMVSRIREKRYEKILVRGYHLEGFWYDSHLWPKSSGIRRALQENYYEKSTIEAVSKTVLEKESSYLFGNISVLVPKPGS